MTVDENSASAVLENLNVNATEALIKKVAEHITNKSSATSDEKIKATTKALLEQGFLNSSAIEIEGFKYKISDVIKFLTKRPISKGIMLDWNSERTDITGAKIAVNDELVQCTASRTQSADEITYTFQGTYKEQSVTFMMKFIEVTKQLKIGDDTVEYKQYLFKAHQKPDFGETPVQVSNLPLTLPSEFLPTNETETEVTPTPMTLSETALSIDVGSSKTVNVLNAQGAITATSGDTNLITTSVSGNVITINAIGATDPNNVTVTVTDGVTTKSITVYSAVSGGGSL